jgi:glutaredoxin 2
LKIMKILIFTHIQEKCSEFQNQIDLRKIDELKKLLYEVTSMNLNITINKLKINSLLDNLCNIL